ncbi:MAG: MarR family transcriptional regulator [Armatimonas sp.]
MPRVRSKSAMSPGHELAMALRRAYLLMHRRADASFHNAGVTADQFVVLGALAEAGALTQQELASRIASDANTLRAMLLLLEKKELVRREPHPTDGRARLVRLTEAGQEQYDLLWKESDEFRERLAALLGPDDTGALIALLNRLARALPPGEVTK